MANRDLHLTRNIYEQLEEEAKGVLEGFEKKAHERGVEKVK